MRTQVSCICICIYGTLDYTDIEVCCAHTLLCIYSSLDYRDIEVCCVRTLLFDVSDRVWEARGGMVQPVPQLRAELQYFLKKTGGREGRGGVMVAHVETKTTCTRVPPEADGRVRKYSNAGKNIFLRKVTALGVLCCFDLLFI